MSYSSVVFLSLPGYCKFYFFHGLLLCVFFLFYTPSPQAQLTLLLKGGDCLKDLGVCNFLNLGMVTYYNSSETQCEGVGQS